MIRFAGMALMGLGLIGLGGCGAGVAARAGSDVSPSSMAAQDFGSAMQRRDEDVRVRDQAVAPMSDTQKKGAGRPVTYAERQTAWSRHRAEYERRVRTDGQPAADQWLDDGIRAED